MLNNLTIVGRLTKDPRITTTRNGNMIANFNLAVNRPYKNKQTGQRDADFPSVVAFGQTAEIIDQYAKKGMLVGVVGRIQTRNYENNEGQRVYVTEVVAESFQMLESRKERETNNQSASYDDDIQITDDQLPF